MSDVDDLVEKAQKQLEEHCAWLAREIMKVDGIEGSNAKLILVLQARTIKLRIARAANGVASVVYEYPDELFAFLRSETAPQHLRDSLAGGQVVDPNQPTFSAKRVAE